MPPGPAYNFLCVLSSFADILTHAARIRAAQTTLSVPTIVSAKGKQRKIDSHDVDPIINLSETSEAQINASYEVNTSIQV
jgi:aarF domain-containing kinase